MLDGNRNELVQNYADSKKALPLSKVEKTLEHPPDTCEDGVIVLKRLAIGYFASIVR
jgi:hypothetical protein